MLYDNEIFIFHSFSGQVQKKILGDIREQKISQVYDEDAREEKVYRRPPTFLVIASKIVRPSTVYQVCFVDISSILLDLLYFIGFVG